MASSINASTSGVGGVITTADASGVLDLQTADVTRAYVSASGLTVNRINSASEGGQLDLCRSTDNTSAWAVDVYGSTSTPSLRFVDNIASATRAEIDGSGNFSFNSGYGSAAKAYGCRAWVNFNGTGTVAIRASGNVTSITDNGTGDYTINYTNAMPDANYNIVLTGARQNGSYNSSAVINNTNSLYTTSATRITVTQLNDALVDIPNINATIFR